MQMNQPAPPNALDANAQGLIGLGMDRVDGPDKVCGTAPYAYEVQEAPERRCTASSSRRRSAAAVWRASTRSKPSKRPAWCM
jgi:CO/xanthine dehydrogenase Mo-binding subunit